MGSRNCCCSNTFILVYLELASQVKVFYAEPNIQPLVVYLLMSLEPVVISLYLVTSA